jgi:hypothetical protein
MIMVAAATVTVNFPMLFPIYFQNIDEMTANARGAKMLCPGNGR